MNVRQIYHYFSYSKMIHFLMNKLTSHENWRLGILCRFKIFMPMQESGL